MHYTNIDQWLAKMRNLASKNGVSVQDMQQRYVLEEFVRKISASIYKDFIVFKGGFIVSALLGIDERKTRDIDFTYKSYIYHQEEVEKMIHEIIETQTDCFFQYRMKSIKEEQLDDHYSGYSVMIEATRGKTRINLKLDISNNTLIYPNSLDYDLESFIDKEPIHIQTYPVENIIAEKYETTMDRGEFNTRMRDLLDIYFLFEENFHIIDKKILAETIIAVSKDRNTLDNLYHFDELLEDLRSSDIFKSNFNKYMQNYYPTKKITLENIFETFSKINRLVQNMKF